MTHALTDLLFGSSAEPGAIDIIDRYFASDFTDTIDGVRTGRAAFEQHVVAMRSKPSGGRVIPL